ncbi:MAG: LytTR family transcriptional regulator DNA-binding domain-containing protein [bacterium]
MIIDGDRNLKVKTHEGIHLIKIDDIFYFKSEVAYSNIFIKDEQVIIVCKQFCEIEKYVRNYDFLRIHKSFLVNITLKK